MELGPSARLSVIRLQLEDKSMIPFMGCYDVVKMYDGACGSSDFSESDLSPAFEECGAAMPSSVDTVLATSGCVRIHFQTDEHVAFRGFNVEVSREEKSELQPRGSGRVVWP